MPFLWVKRHMAMFGPSVEGLAELDQWSEAGQSVEAGI